MNKKERLAQPSCFLKNCRYPSPARHRQAGSVAKLEFSAIGETAYRIAAFAASRGAGTFQPAFATAPKGHFPYRAPATLAMRLSDASRTLVSANLSDCCSGMVAQAAATHIKQSRNVFMPLSFESYRYLKA